MTDEALDQAIEEWIQRTLAGDEPDPVAFAREKKLSPEQLAPRVRQALWLLARHQEARDDARASLSRHLPIPPFAVGGESGVDVLEEAGRGAMGVVFRGIQRATGQTVAVKMLNPEQSRATTGHTRFRQEARAARRLEHPNIVTVLDAGEQDGLAYIVMEWVDGESLANLLVRRRTSGVLDASVHRQSAMLLAKIARALHHAHEHDLLHRDVKPANILVDKSGEPKLADFGLVRVLDAVSLTGTGDLVGSPAYMSPEQLLGRRDLTPRSDVYSLGITLYECLTLRRPFAADTLPATQRQILAETPALPRSVAPEVPEALQWICLVAMAREPGVRYQTALEFAEDLEALTRLPTPTRSRLSKGFWHRESQRRPVNGYDESRLLENAHSPVIRCPDHHQDPRDLIRPHRYVGHVADPQLLRTPVTLEAIEQHLPALHLHPLKRLLDAVLRDHGKQPTPESRILDPVALVPQVQR